VRRCSPCLSNLLERIFGVAMTVLHDISVTKNRYISVYLLSEPFNVIFEDNLLQSGNLPGEGFRVLYSSNLQKDEPRTIGAAMAIGDARTCLARWVLCIEQVDWLSCLMPGVRGLWRAVYQTALHTIFR
jgi:hypothetical protein